MGILRVLNTNIEGKTNVMFALTSIKGIGRRYANLVLKKADIPLHKRAGELTEEDTDKIITIMQNPRQYKIPDWFLNRQRDITLSIQEPVWDLVLTGILHDSDDLVSVLLGQFTSSLVKRDVSLPH